MLDLSDHRRFRCRRCTRESISACGSHSATMSICESCLEELRGDDSSRMEPPMMRNNSAKWAATADSTGRPTNS